MSRTSTASAAPAGLLLIGGYPQPFGGVSIHVQRLAQQCVAHGIPTRVLDPHPSSIPVEQSTCTVERAGTTRPGCVAAVARAILGHRGWVHFHGSRLNSLALFAPLVGVVRGERRYALTVHGAFGSSWAGYGRTRRAFVRSFVRSMDLVVAVSDEVADSLVHATGLAREQVVVLPAFIPFVGSAFDEADVPLLESFVRRHRKVVFASGTLDPLYGLELIADVAARAEFVDVGFIVNTYVFREPADRLASDELRSTLERLPNVLHAPELSPPRYDRALRSSDVFVRTSTQDGDSVAVREAAHAGVPVVASDCVTRPAGAYVFETASADSLASTLDLVLAADEPRRCVQLDDTVSVLLQSYATE